MNLLAARQHIDAHLSRMQAAYGAVVFDEWAILGMSPRESVLFPGVMAYKGARPDKFAQDIRAESTPLRTVASGRDFHEGDFEFALEARGLHHDAFMKLGPASYLICNNTAKTMEEIRADPSWLKAQRSFFELGEKFRADPLVAGE